MVPGWSLRKRPQKGSNVSQESRAAAEAKPPSPAVDWESEIQAAIKRRAEPVEASIPRRIMNGASSAVQITCNDGKDYIVKGAQLGRVVINEQIVAHLARAIGAPVPDARLVLIDEKLIQANPKLLGHMKAGLAHGSMSILDEIVEGKDGLKNSSVDENRPRFARLAVLFGWTIAGDIQFFYDRQSPFLVHSFDHGYFFTGNGNWTIASLAGTPSATLCESIAQPCAFQPAEVNDALSLLEKVAQSTIADAVAAPADSWVFSLDERVAMASFLFRRQAELLAKRQLQGAA